MWVCAPPPWSSVAPARSTTSTEARSIGARPGTPRRCGRRRAARRPRRPLGRVARAGHHPRRWSSTWRLTASSRGEGDGDGVRRAVQCRGSGSRRRRRGGRRAAGGQLPRAMRRFIRARFDPAAVRPGAERQVAVGRPVEVEGVRARELGLVAVGRRPVDEDALAGPADPLPADLGVAGGGSGDGDERRVEAHQLLDRAADQLGAPARQLRDGGLRQPDHELAERAGGGVQAAEDQQLDDPEDLVTVIGRPRSRRPARRRPRRRGPRPAGGDQVADPGRHALPRLGPARASGWTPRWRGR